MQRSGHRVTRIVHLASGQDHSWNTVSLDSTSWSWMRPLTRTILPFQIRNIFEMQSAQNRLDKVMDSLSPDVVNVHNLHSYGARRAGWSVGLVKICANRAPTVWTLHDGCQTESDWTAVTARDIHLSKELLLFPNPSKAKLNPKLVFAGLTLWVTPRVAVQHSQNERNLVLARKPINLLSSTS